MTTTSPTARRLAFLLASVLALSGFNVSADSHEPAPPGVLESFLCTYVDGKDRGDLDSATEFYKKQAAKAGIPTPPAYLWTKMKGTADTQVVWHNVYENLAAFGAQMDAEGASSDMAAVVERYDTVLSCEPLLGSITPVYQRGETNGGEGAFVAAYACRTNGAPNTAMFADLDSHIEGVLGTMGTAAPIATYGIAPMTGDPAGPNAVYFNVFESASHWASFEGQINGTAAGQMLVRHFTTTLNCATNLWGSEQIIGGE